MQVFSDERQDAFLHFGEGFAGCWHGGSSGFDLLSSAGAPKMSEAHGLVVRVGFDASRGQHCSQTHFRACCRKTFEHLLEIDTVRMYVWNKCSKACECTRSAQPRRNHHDDQRTASTGKPGCSAALDCTWASSIGRGAAHPRCAGCRCRYCTDPHRDGRT